MTIKIVVMDKGFVSVGKYSAGTEWVKLENAAVIRYWGTTGGLGQLAKEGPQSATKLDPTPTEHIPLHAIIKTIDCDPKVWKKPLGLGSERRGKAGAK